MKKLYLLLFVLLSSLSWGQQVYLYRIVSNGVNATGNTLYSNTGGLTATYASLSWTVNGTLSACTIQVNFSNDGVNVAGQLISSQTCTSSGSIIAGATSTPAYVQVAYTITPVGNGYVSFVGQGCSNSTCTVSSGGGAVTSVFTRTGAVVATSGDYTCAQVTGCGGSPGFNTIQTGTNTTATMTVGFGATLNVASGAVIDFSLVGTGTFKVPQAAGFVSSATKNIGLDTTTNIYHLFSNSADAFDVNTTNTTTTATFLPFATATAGVYTNRAIATTDLPAISTTVNSQTCTIGSSCTIPFQTNGTNNTSQAGVNFLTSTTNTVGLTVTPTNSATNGMKFEVTGAVYTGNAATSTTAANLTGCTGSTAGDICVYNSGWTRLAGNAVGTKFLQETSAGVASWATSSSTPSLDLVTGAAAAATATETAAGNRWQYAGVETAALSSPFSIVNTNSTNNLTSLGGLIGAAGTSTGGIGLLVFNVSGNPIQSWYSGGSISGGTYTVGTVEATLDKSGNMALAGALTTNSASNICGTSTPCIGGVAGTTAPTATSGDDFIFFNSTIGCIELFVSTTSSGCAPVGPTSAPVSGNLTSWGANFTQTDSGIAQANVLTTASGIPESKLTGSAAQTTITETGTGHEITRAGVETAALTYPYVFQNTNATNTTSGALVAYTVGAGNAQVPLLVLQNATAGDLADFGAGTVTNGVVSATTYAAKIGNTGLLTLGAATGCTTGTSGGLCANEGTEPTGAATVDEIGADSTQHAVEINNNNTGPMPVSRTACINVTPVTVAANVTTDQLLMSCSFNANLLNVIGRTFKVYSAGVFSTAAASTASLTFKAKLCTVSGCGSGTVISPITTTTGATAALSATNLSWSQTSYVATQTAGATSAYEAHGFMTIDLSATAATPDSVYQDTNTATVGTIDSTGALFLQMTVSASAASTSNSFTQRLLVVEIIN